MLGVEMYTTIKTLWSLNKSKNEISKLTGQSFRAKNLKKGGAAI